MNRNYGLIFEQKLNGRGIEIKSEYIELSNYIVSLVSLESYCNRLYANKVTIRHRGRSIYCRRYSPLGV